MDYPMEHEGKENLALVTCEEKEKSVVYELQTVCTLQHAKKIMTSFLR